MRILRSTELEAGELIEDGRTQDHCARQRITPPRLKKFDVGGRHGSDDSLDLGLGGRYWLMSELPLGNGCFTLWYNCQFGIVW